MKRRICLDAELVFEPRVSVSHACLSHACLCCVCTTFKVSSAALCPPCPVPLATAATRPSTSPICSRWHRHSQTASHRTRSWWYIQPTHACAQGGRGAEARVRLQLTHQPSHRHRLCVHEELVGPCARGPPVRQVERWRGAVQWQHNRGRYPRYSRGRSPA